jgi:hypothetical protein
MTRARGPAVFIKNCDRLVASDAAGEFFRAVVTHAKGAGLVNREHSGVDAKLRLPHEGRAFRVLPGSKPFSLTGWRNTCQIASLRAPSTSGMKGARPTPRYPIGHRPWLRLTLAHDR